MYKTFSVLLKWSLFIHRLMDVFSLVEINVVEYQYMNMVFSSIRGLRGCDTKEKIGRKAHKISKFAYKS